MSSAKATPTVSSAKPYFTLNTLKHPTDVGESQRGHHGILVYHQTPDDIEQLGGHRGRADGIVQVALVRPALHLFDLAPVGIAVVTLRPHQVEHFLLEPGIDLAGLCGQPQKIRLEGTAVGDPLLFGHGDLVPSVIAWDQFIRSDNACRGARKKETEI